MVKIILILALLQYISNFLFGYKSNMLVCGIFGQSTNKPENLDVNGVHILGIYNIERGKMSCGLSWDGDVQYGINADKLYTDFIINREIKPVKTPIMIGHTRQPSYGFAITADNAHPFGFGTSKDGEGYEMIFCHNGTLKNHKELAKKYNIELTEKIINTSHLGNKYESSRDKIDSEILGEILYKTKRFHVLSEYIGAAALAWTWIDEPNKLYLWSGASKKIKGSVNCAELEERPLNVFCKNNNSMFFSSLKNSLTVLGASEKEDLQIDYNTVYVITDGDFKNAKKHKVSRVNSGQEEESFNVYSKYDGYSDRINSRGFHNENYCDWENLSSRNTQFNQVKAKPVTTVSINLREDKPLKELVCYKDKVYSKQLRYFKNEKLITGIYLYIKNWGFIFAGKNINEAASYFSKIKDKEFNIARGEFGSSYQTSFIPFTQDFEKTQLHYFKSGVMLKTFLDYLTVSDIPETILGLSNGIEGNVLSHMSKHPTTNFTSLTTNNTVYLEGKPYSGTFTELGFEKVYSFQNGSLIKWFKREDLLEIPISFSETNLLSANKTVNLDKDLFNKVVTDIETEEYIMGDSLDDDFISEYVSEAFQRHSEEILETIVEFSDWKTHVLIKPALETLNLIKHTLKEYIEKPVKNKLK